MHLRNNRRMDRNVKFHSGRMNSEVKMGEPLQIIDIIEKMNLKVDVISLFRDLSNIGYQERR